MEPGNKLRVTFAGVEMRSPLGVGIVYLPMGQYSAMTPERHASFLLKHAQAGAGYVELSCTYSSPEELKRRPKPAVPTPKPFGTRWLRTEGMEGLHLFYNTIGFTPESVTNFDYRRKIIEILKKDLPEGVAIIVSSRLKDNAEAAVLSAKKVEELGVDLLELQLMCAYELSGNGVVEEYLRKGDAHTQVVKEVVAAVARAVRIPVGVKLTPGEFGYPGFLNVVRHLRDAGVKYIQVSNSGASIAPPDIYNRGKSPFPFADGNPFTGISGAPLRSECYRDVAAIARFAPGVDIAASGGFLRPQYAVELMMLGAGLVQTVTGVAFHGRKLVKRTSQFIERFMDEQGYSSLSEIVGLGVQYIKPCNTVALTDVVAEVDTSVCTGCGTCRDGLCVAMESQADGKARPKRELCWGCGLCVAICPNKAVKLAVR